MKIRADEKQNEIISTNGKLYVNVNQQQLTETLEDGTIQTFWEMEAIEISHKKDAESTIKDYHESIKKESLSNIIVTVASGKRFYADPESRADISDAILEAQEIGAEDADTTTWKTPDGLQAVTIADLKEARKLGLVEKGKIVGVSNESV